MHFRSATQRLPSPCRTSVASPPSSAPYPQTMPLWTSSGPFCRSSSGSRWPSYTSEMKSILMYVQKKNTGGRGYTVDFLSSLFSWQQLWGNPSRVWEWTWSLRDCPLMLLLLVKYKSTETSYNILMYEYIKHPGASQTELYINYTIINQRKKFLWVMVI